MHDIGKNLVGMMLEGSGMEVIDAGVDLSPDRIVEAVKTHQPQFLQAFVTRYAGVSKYKAKLLHVSIAFAGPNCRKSSIHKLNKACKNLLDNNPQ